jgi:hypothetical protein
VSAMPLGAASAVCGAAPWASRLRMLGRWRRRYTWGSCNRATRGHSRRPMRRSAIMTGAVDLVLPVAKIPEILAKYGRQMVFNGELKGPAPDDHRPDRSCAAIPRAAAARSAAAPGSSRALCCHRRTLCDDPPVRPSIVTGSSKDTSSGEGAMSRSPMTS